MLNNSTVAHNFIYGETSNGSNLYSETYNKFVLLYSYSSLMAIKFNKENLIIVSSRISSYSNTSHKHHNHLTRAINNETVIYINDIGNKYETIETLLNNDALENEIYNYMELSKKAKRARKYDYSYVLKKSIDTLNNIVKYGNIDKRKSNYKLYLQIVNNINIDTLLNASIENEKKEKQKQAIKAYKRNLERLETFTGVTLKGYTKLEINSYNFLKVNSEEIKTSGGVTVDLKEGLILYKMLLSGKDINGSKIGYYTILKHNNKTVKIGCHTIPLKELKRVLGGLI